NRALGDVNYRPCHMKLLANQQQISAERMVKTNTQISESGRHLPSNTRKKNHGHCWKLSTANTTVQRKPEKLGNQQYSFSFLGSLRMDGQNKDLEEALSRWT